MFILYILWYQCNAWWGLIVTLNEGNLVRAIILAAGEGKRLRPFTESMSKVMLPVANKPILEYVVDAVTGCGIEDIVMVLGYGKERIMDYFGDGKEFGANIKYVFQEKQLGTGHALIQAKEEFEDASIVLAGDNIIDSSLIYKVINLDGLALLYVTHDRPSKYGVVKVDGGLIKNIYEKPKEDIGNLISTGIFKFEGNISNDLEKHVSQGHNSLTSFVQILLKNGKDIASVKGNGIWQDAVYPWDLLNINETALQNCSRSVAGKIEKGVEIRGNVSIGENSIIRSGSYIIGPVAIGEGCEIGPNVCIFPSTSIGSGVTVEVFSEIKNSIIMNNVVVGSRSSVLQSVIGKGCEIGSNFTSTAGDAYIKIDDSNEFHMVKDIGAFIGENCEIGSGVLIDHGKIIGKNCKISAQRRITENVKSEGIVV